MTTATETRDQAETRRAADRLTEAIALLAAVATDMGRLIHDGTQVACAGQIASFALSAADTADLALMYARNEAKLAGALAGKRAAH